MISALTSAFQMPYLHFTAICAALVLLCLYFVIKRFAAYFADLRRKWNPPAPYDPILLGFKRRAFFFWLVLLIPSLILLYFALYLTRYQWIGSREETAGEVVALHHGVFEFRDYSGQITNYPVKETKQAAAGLFLHFPKWMRYLGLTTYHQMIGFRSPSEIEFRYMKPTPDYIRLFGDDFFCWVYRNQNWFFMKAIYRESPYFTGSGHIIYVTHSGYIVQ